MNVLVLNQFFYPDLSATAQLATELAEDLVAAGARVTALAARGTYLGGRRLAREEVHAGIRVVRVPCASFGKASAAQRVADYGTFFAAAAARLALRERPDVVLALSTPPLIATLGSAMRVKRSRLAYWVQDLYPEVAIALGVVAPRSPIALTLSAASRYVLSRAHAVVALGDAMAEKVIAKGARPSRVHVVPNWADGRTIRPIAHQENAFRREHGLAGRRVVLYSGNMGRGHDMTTLLAAARAFSDEDVVFLFVGDGAKRREVEAAARELRHVRLLPYQPREFLAHSLSAGDVHLVAQDPNTVGLIEPSKLYGVLAAGRPVVYVGPLESEVARTITREGVGRVVANGDTEGAAAAIRAVMADAGPLGRRARIAFEERYDRRHRTAHLGRVLEATCCAR